MTTWRGWPILSIITFLPAAGALLILLVAQLYARGRALATTTASDC